MATLLLGSARASAQPYPYPYAPPYPPGPTPMTEPAFPVELSATGEESVSLSVQSRTRREEPAGGCTTPCTLLLPRGRYRLTLEEGEATASGRANLDIERASQVVVSPDLKATRHAGLALGIGGPVLVVSGVLLMLSGGASLLASGTGHSSGGEDERRDQGAVTFGGVLLLAGVAATPIGWILYGGSFRPGVDVR